MPDWIKILQDINVEISKKKENQEKKESYALKS